MIRLGIGGVAKDVSEAKAGIAGVVRNVSSGFTCSGGIIRQFFGNLTRIDHFEIKISSIEYKSASDSEYAQISKPTAYGYTNYGTNPDVSVGVYENGDMTIRAYNGMGILLRADMSAVFSDGHSTGINLLFKNTNSSAVLSGNCTENSVGSGSKSISAYVLGKAMAVPSAWSESSLSSSNPYTFYSFVSCSGYTYAQISFTNLSITVNGVSYPIKLVL